MPLISVIVPVYNVEMYLHRCIDSILNQTYQDFELILIDDGSTDNSGKICEEYAKDNSNIIIIHQENKGQAVARNTALDWVFTNSDCEFINFIDSDDWVHPRYLEILLLASQTTNAQISQCRYIETKEYNAFENIRPEIFEVLPEEQYINWYNASSCTKLFKKSCFQGVRFPEGMIYEDVAISYKMIFSQPFITIIDACLYFYYTRSDSTVHSDWMPKHYARVQVWEDQRKYFSKLNNDELMANVMERYLNVLCTQIKQISSSKAINVITRIGYKTKVRYLLRKHLILYGKRLNCPKTRMIQNAFPLFSWCYWTIKGIGYSLKKKIRNRK